MSIWSRISDALSALAKGESLSDVFAHLRTPPERSAGFAIAVIALGAKMAKADGLVTRDEVSAFREVFTIPRGEEKQAARVFNLARTDVAGFDLYAQRIADMFGPADPALFDLMEGLFFIALADGEYHPNENEFLLHVARIFGIPEEKFFALRARFVPDTEASPYQVLGVPKDMPIREIRKVWRQAVRDSHPDVMVARGVPEEAIKLAEKRLIAVNRAWEEINARQGSH
ncbi:molecular chaperone DjiA [Aliiroseovarius crassostreae]|uniref:molecular chaperone DjiA n=1 Tax=Aliiroseovarius crassostreae TaxID=154981 RepID=UPI002207AD91|nr:molecular chaperone DjiA [Aliiroseovarius crassostreae]UWQ08625.1 molecular chaperone DjiA [Aliiroseovarius crassostreae]UWQ11731.1 molecular chaperone DjiA [Aliiroseovarius crassostreae]